MPAGAADGVTCPLVQGALAGSGARWESELRDGRGTGLLVASALKSVPGPARDAHAFGDIVSTVVVARHGRGGGPGEVVVQHVPQGFGRVQPHVLQCLAETGDRPAVHLLVW